MRRAPPEHRAPRRPATRSPPGRERAAWWDARTSMNRVPANLLARELRRGGRNHPGQAPLGHLHPLPAHHDAKWRLQARGRAQQAHITTRHGLGALWLALPGAAVFIHDFANTHLALHWRKQPSRQPSSMEEAALAT